jgi:hypothetical protein
LTFWPEHNVPEWPNENAGKDLANALAEPEFEKFSKYQQKLAHWSAVTETRSLGGSPSDHERCKCRVVLTVTVVELRKSTEDHQDAQGQPRTGPELMCERNTERDLVVYKHDVHVEILVSTSVRPTSVDTVYKTPGAGYNGPKRQTPVTTGQPGRPDQPD